MVNVMMFIATSADGFIADKNGGVAWLDEYNNMSEDYGFKEFYESIDALAIGNTTYKQILTFGPWSFNGKMSYIFSDKDTPVIDNEYIECVGSDVAAFMKKIEAKGVKRLWLMGGAKLVESFYDLGFIDEYIVTIMPKKLGEGIALPAPVLATKGFHLIKTIEYPLLSGVVQKQYKKNKH